ncbi:MAG: glycoside hydrolase family 88 protein [Rikenellaceae bacterium]|nr:glycoside hydrolase family 88 protein [Rikenellaceae bacterium]
MKKLFFAAFFALIFAACGNRHNASEMELLIDRNMQLAIEQYKYMSTLLPPDRLPMSYENGEFKTSGTGWWCSGFYPGTLWYLYEYSGDEQLLAEAIRSTELLEKEQYNTRTHDLGFMLFCSYGHAYRLTGNPAYKEVIMTGSESLSSRYNHTIGAIRSWDFGTWQFPVIIDNMMNLEMLTWATRESRNPRFHEIAVTHADKTLANHFRPDASSYHVIDYDRESGERVGAHTWQGYSDDSSWARGQAWGLYGYTMMSRETGDRAYLDHARRIADFMLGHPNMPDDLIPYWDFNAPDIPDTSRDASAAAVTASALVELSSLANEPRYLDAARTIVKTLSTPTYLAEAGTNGGFILKQSVGAMPFNSEVDVPLTYADYYFVEAMMRLRGL